MTTPVVHSIELIAKCGTDSCCLENSGWVADCLIRSSYSHWVVMGLSVFGIIWGSIQFMAVSNILSTSKHSQYRLKKLKSTIPRSKSMKKQLEKLEKHVTTKQT